MKKSVFSYNYMQMWTLKNFDSKWCFCCRRKMNKDDFLQKDAQSKLKREMDLLEVLKTLRLAKFMGQMFISQRQKEMIKFFKDYRLEAPGSDHHEDDDDMSDLDPNESYQVKSPDVSKPGSLIGEEGQNLAAPSNDKNELSFASLSNRPSTLNSFYKK